MCYYIGIEDLVANALIELVEKTGKREVHFETLNKYGEIIIRQLNSESREAVFIFSKEKTNGFFHDCSDYFTLRESTTGTVILLNDNVSTDVLRARFRVNLAFDLLKAFVNKSALQALGALAYGG